MNLPSHIKILELERYSIIELSDVKEAYKRLQKIWHPDLHVGKVTLEEAKTRATQINNAYEVISEQIENSGDISNHHEAFINEDLGPDFTPKHSWNRRAFTPGFPDETVFEIFVKSSNILSIGYNPYTEKLYVKFQDNAVYEYRKVSMSIFDELLNAESHGKYAHRNIFSTFDYRRCTESNKKYTGPVIEEKPKFFLTHPPPLTLRLD